MWSFLFSILAFNVLIFVHELGHYIAAKCCGIPVQEFSIGFGKALFSWNINDEKWKFGCIPFGGYVYAKDLDDDESKCPAYKQIIVAVAGPFFNIALGLVIFFSIWELGGIDNNVFDNYTTRVGYVNPATELYKLGLRPGDEIVKYDSKPYEGFKNFVIDLTLGKNSLKHIEGFHIDYRQQRKTPFSYDTKAAIDPTTFLPASYILYKESNEKFDISSSSIKENDRIFWVSGIPIFSLKQLNDKLQKLEAFVTLQRKDTIFHAIIPRIKNGKTAIFPFVLQPDNRVGASYKAEIVDSDITSIESQDRIIAVDGVPVSDREATFKQLAEQRFLIIVQSADKFIKGIDKSAVDRSLDNDFATQDLDSIVKNIGVADKGVKNSLRLLTPVTVKPTASDPKLINHYKSLLPAKSLQKIAKRKILGMRGSSLQVHDNPNPFVMFVQVLRQIKLTFTKLFSKLRNVQHLSGPIGVFSIIKHNYEQSHLQGLFFIGMISIHLAVLNMLPIPPLDGSRVCFALFEMCTRRRISSKVKTNILKPAILIFLTLALCVTFFDIKRLLF